MVTRNLSSMHSICTSPISILLVRLPPPPRQNFAYVLPSISLEVIAIYPGRRKSKGYVNSTFSWGGGGGALEGKQGVFWEMCIWRYLNSGRGNKTQSRQGFLALPAGMDFSGKVSAQAQFIPLNLIAQEKKRARLGQKVSHFHLQKDTVIHHLFKCRIRSPFTGPTVQSY